MTPPRKRHSESLAAYLQRVCIDAIRAVVAEAPPDVEQRTAEALADLLEHPHLRAARSAASPHERALAAGMVASFAKELKEAGAPPGARLWVRNPDGDTAGLPEMTMQQVVRDNLQETSKGIVLAADEALLESTTAQPPTQAELAAWLATGAAENTRDAAASRLAALWDEAAGSVTVTGWAFGGLVGRRGGVEYHAPAAEVLALFKTHEPNRANPLASLLQGWLRRPLPVPASTRTEGRIIPARLAQVDPADRRAGTLFSPAAHLVQQDGGHQHVMPGFEHAQATPALPLQLYDLGIGPGVSAGRGAPLALRLFVEGVLVTPQWARDSGLPHPVEITLRALLARLYPGGRQPRPNEYWPRLMRAVEALESPAARVPWYDAETGRGGLRRIVSVGDIPRGPNALDDLVQLLVNLPPGSGAGPQVSDNLGLWGARSANAYRLLLNLAYLWYAPGVTVRPLFGPAAARRWPGGPTHYQSANPAHYQVVSDDDLVHLTFPTSTRQQRRNLRPEARKALGEVQAAGEVRVLPTVGGVYVLPPPKPDAGGGADNDVCPCAE